MTKSKKRVPRWEVAKYALVFATAWIISISILFLWSYRREKDASLESARISARAQFDKDVLYRRWNASHGGIYVPVTEQTQPNPFLTNIKKRDIETTKGKHLTLINPAYMTRQVHELGYSTAGVRGHITSLNPIRPANAADPWERNALQRFEEGFEETSSVELLDGIDQLRLMRPLMTEKGCLKCHAEQGYEVGDVRGGISVAVPMQPYVDIFQDEIKSVAGALGGIWLLGMLAIGAASYHFNIRFEEREQSRKELDRSEEQLALVLHGSGLGSWDWDVVHNQVRFNERWAEMKGYQTKEILPQMESWQKLIHPDDLPEVLNRLRAHLEGTSPGYEAEFRMRTKKGDWVWVLDRGRVMERDKSGKPLRVCGTHLDITSRKNIEQELQQAQKLESVGQLAAGVAHEINTPIQFVGDNLRFLQDSFDDLLNVCKQHDSTVATLKDRPLSEDEVKQLEQELEKSDLDYLKTEVSSAISQSLEGTGRVSKIVGAMKEFAHPGGSTKKDANLNEAIETTVIIAKNEWKYVTDLKMQFDEFLPMVPCLVSEFNQVILNLIVNARDAIEERIAQEPEMKQGLITIRTSHDESWVIVSVEDSGTGMSEKVRSRIFEPFYTTKEVGKGSGQGLAMARSIIVDKHDGRLDVTSEMGKGTCFTIKLPLESCKEEA